MFRVVLSDSDSDSGTRKGCFVVKRTHCAGHPGYVRGSLWTGNRQCVPALTPLFSFLFVFVFCCCCFVCLFSKQFGQLCFICQHRVSEKSLRCSMVSIALYLKFSSFFSVGNNSSNLQAFKAQTCFHKMLKPIRHNSM